MYLQKTVEELEERLVVVRAARDVENRGGGGGTYAPSFELEATNVHEEVFFLASKKIAALRHLDFATSHFLSIRQFWDQFKCFWDGAARNYEASLVTKSRVGWQPNINYAVNF